MSGTTTDLIRVMLVDDNDRVRHSVAALLGEFPDLQVVGQAHSGSEAIAMASELRPHVIVMDILMQGVNGIDAARSIRQRNPQIQVVLLSSYSDSRFETEARLIGVSDYLLKSISSDEIVNAIRRARLATTAKAASSD